MDIDSIPVEEKEQSRFYRTLGTSPADRDAISKGKRRVLLYTVLHALLFLATLLVGWSVIILAWPEW